MTESAPLLEDFNEDVPRIGEAHTHVHTKKTPASAYFRPLFKILAITTVVISFVTIVLLFATYIILRKAPVSYSTWSAEKVTKALAILVCALFFLSASLAFNYKNIDVRSPCRFCHQCSRHFPHLAQYRCRRRSLGVYSPKSGRAHKRDPNALLVSIV